MHRVAPPYGEARDDYAIFAGLAERLGAREAFTEGRTRPPMAANISTSRRAPALAALNLPAPELRRVLGAAASSICRSSPTTAARLAAFPRRSRRRTAADAERQDRDLLRDDRGLRRGRLPRPSDLAAAGRRAERRRRRCILVANQPATRLHSQLDFGGHSAGAKHRGREVARMHPADAAARGIADGDIVRLFNARGACLAGVRITDGIRRGVVQLPTGAWYDPADPDGGQRRSASTATQRAHARRRHVAPGAGLHRAAHDGRGRALRRQSAADPGLRSAGRFRLGSGEGDHRVKHPGGWSYLPIIDLRNFRVRLIEIKQK